MRPLVISDARSAAPFKDLDRTTELGIGSYIGVPIVLSNNQVYGTLCAIDPEAHNFNPEDTDLLVLLARLVAYQIDHAEIEKQLKASVAEAKQLAMVADRMSTIGRILASTLDPVEVAKAAVDMAIALTGADRAGVALPGDDGLLRFSVTAGSEPGLAAANVFAPGEGHVGRTFAEARPFRIDDISEDESSHQRDIDAGLRIRGFIAIPLLTGGRCLGVLAASSYEASAFSLEHENLLEHLAILTAVALGNAEEHHSTLREEGQLRAVLNATSEAFALVSPDRRFLSVNRGFSRILGFESDQLLGHRLEEFAQDVVRTFTDPEGFSTLVGGSAADPVRQITGRFTLQGAPPRELELYSSPVHTPDSQYIGRLYVFRDVTREREVERMKSEFISMISHELRTPLTSIKGYTDLIFDGEAGPITPDQTEFLEVIRQNADRLMALVNDLLDMSRIEAGKVELERTKVEMLALIRHVTGSLRPQLESKKQQLVLNLPSAPINIFADQNRLIQIVTNLLSNAHKYTPPNGEITLSLTYEAGVVRMDVCDNGIGMSSEEQSQLFSKFFRAKNRTAREAGGTGLGLTITRSLVELHGGEISVQSSPGNGSTFTVTLPAPAVPVPEGALE